MVSRLPSLAEELNPLFPELSVIYPHEGRLLDLVNIAELNAREGLDAHFLSARLEDDNLALLDHLGKLLGIETPLRIELFDNSHLQGSSPVGAMARPYPRLKRMSSPKPGKPWGLSYQNPEPS